MSIFQTNNALSLSAAPNVNTNPNKDTEIPSPPEDTVSRLKFSPAAPPNSLILASTSWNNLIRIWEINLNGQVTPKIQQQLQAPILDGCWTSDGTKFLAASADNKAYLWDIASNNIQQIAQHDGPIRTIHYISSPKYQCVMTASWDKTLKFWDLRSHQPGLSYNLQGKAYCSSVYYPLAIVALDNKKLSIYSLENSPTEFKTIESPLKHQSQCIDIFLDKQKQQPSGFALGCTEGRVAIQYINQALSKDNFTFKCHRSSVNNQNIQDIYVVNDLRFHPIHGTMATVGSDGRYKFWDKDAQTKLFTSEAVDLPITACDFDPSGNVFAYAVGYDWSKGHEYNDLNKKPRMFLRSCMDNMKPTQKK